MVVEELIEHGLDPNVADDEGLYPIHQAAMVALTSGGCLLCLRCLINANVGETL